MAGGSGASRELSPRRIVGFACAQAFIFFLVYFGTDQPLRLGELVLTRFDVLAKSLFMVAGFALTRIVGEGGLSRLLSRPLLYLYGVLAAAGSLLHVYLVDGGIAVMLAEGALTGVPCSFLLAAWGCAFGEVPSGCSIPEVFFGSLAAALLCWVFSFFPDSEFAVLALRILPLASVVNMEAPIGSDGETSGQAQAPAVIELESAPGQVLSLKILAGTFLFGMAAGLVAFLSADGEVQLPHYQACMLLFGAFLAGALTLLLSDGFGRGAALNKSYRLAVFVMMAGVLAIPVTTSAESPLSGSTVVFAGYLGLQSVLISLYLVMAEITATDCALSLSAGLFFLFGGEFFGALSSEVFLQLAAADALAAMLVCAIAGLIVLVAYVFLFTERDFDMLSEIVSASDTFELMCSNICERYSLSKREGEILVFALRGRTSERIAQELVISKNTVDTHIRRIYGKCNVHSRQELLDLAEAERLRLS